MFKKVVIASLFFALVFLCACAGSEYTPDHEATPQPNTGTITLDDMVAMAESIE